MHQITIHEIDKNIFIPENLGECNRQQYLDMSKLVLMFNMAEIDLRQFRTLGLFNLMNMERSPSDLPGVEEEKWQNIYVLSQLLDSFYEIREDGKMYLVQDYIHNPVKSVKYKALTFRGPKDGFQDMTWGQFVDGIGELMEYGKSGKIESLVKLFAIFYVRPSAPYGSFDMGRRVKFFDLLDIRYVYGFYLLFNSFWTFLTTQSVINVDGREVDLRVIFEQNEGGEDQELEAELEAEYPGLGFRSTSYQLAESQVFGPKEKLDKTNFWEVFLNLYDMMQRYRKREKMMEIEKEKSK